MRALLLMILLLVIVQQLLLVLLLLLLRFVLVTVNFTSTGTSASTSSTSRNCTSANCTTSTCTFSNVKPCVISYHSYKKSEHCSLLIAEVSYYYTASAIELNKLMITLSDTNQTVSSCFSSHCHDLCNSLTYTVSSEIPHAMLPEINPCRTENIDCPGEKRLWIQRVGA
jgi:hypothetical protein